VRPCSLLAPPPPRHGPRPPPWAWHAVHGRLRWHFHLCVKLCMSGLPFWQNPFGFHPPVRQVSGAVRAGCCDVRAASLSCVVRGETAPLRRVRGETERPRTMPRTDMAEKSRTTRRSPLNEGKCRARGARSCHVRYFTATGTGSLSPLRLSGSTMIDHRIIHPYM
jgi:hypothetical protein